MPKLTKNSEKITGYRESAPPLAYVDSTDILRLVLGKVEELSEEQRQQSQAIKELKEENQQHRDDLAQQKEVTQVLNTEVKLSLHKIE